MARPDPAAELARLQEALLKKQASRSLYAFVEQAWAILQPSQSFQRNWHIPLICEYLEAVSVGQLKRLVINLPPRYMKSLLVSVMWPAWEWLRDPTSRWVFVSYSDQLSSKHSLDRRTLITSGWYRQNWGDRVQLSADQNAKHEFQNHRRGVMVATSIGGSITGKGGNRIVVDDPHNPLQAESDAQRETAIRYFTQTLSTRLDDKRHGAMVVVMQRLHEQDLTATCVDLGFELLSLPAESECRTEIVFPRSGRRHVRETGDLLWPEREGPDELAHQKRVLGSAAFAGQYQQRPAPVDGNIFKKDWWQFYDELPAEVQEFAQSWDMAFKDGPDNDYVVGLVAARHGSQIYLVDRVKGQWSFSETCRQFEALAMRYPQAVRKLVEDAANGPAIVSFLGDRIEGVIAVTPQGGKIARARAAQPRVEAGNIYLPNPRPHGVLIEERAWVDDFLHACTVFPRGRHDDDVDAFTQLVTGWEEEIEWVFY
jgi:predicted phage terminase large subunit-like protein